MKAYQYATATNQDPNKLDDDISQRLGDGWELYGNPYTVTDRIGNSTICQAVIMDKETFHRLYVIEKAPVTPP